MKKNKFNAFTLIELLVVISIIAILAGIALPVFGEVQIRGAQTKALSNAKQVGISLRLFAADYNGNFPIFTNPSEATGTANTSNEIFQTLVPDYLPDEGVFSIPGSAYCKPKAGSKMGDGKIAAGENEWAYVVGLSDTSTSLFPLLADGFAPGGTNYVSDETKPGGVWKAKKAVVVRVDGSGTVETTYKRGTGKDAKATVKRPDDPKQDAFKPDASYPWLSGNGVRVLNPIVP
ncbi:MAG: prepilin-type N-terminal cleavage/methylation domain [Chthoniobacter sp.]|jgi:prepilin-type N-terminal cleavage/methylation domain-containing protein|nr:prepilin-type N-terminal cleavage/methylation domain [Chthoniobacter sp.]